MATRRKRKKCKFGLRRDGKCRRTRCSRKLTKKGYCPKGAGSAPKRRRRASTRRRYTRRPGGTYAQKQRYIKRYLRAKAAGRAFHFNPTIG